VFNYFLSRSDNTCPITTPPLITQCPTTNQTELNQYQTACVNGVSSPSLVNECMQVCANCCPDVNTWVDCGQPTPPPDEKVGSAQPSKGVVAGLLIPGVTSHIMSLVFLMHCVKREAPSSCILYAYRLCNVLGTAFTAPAAGLLGGLPAGIGVMIGGLSLWGAGELLIRYNKKRMADGKGPLLDFEFN
jgi:hypothetical protein